MITYPAITTWAIKMTASCSSYLIAVDKGRLQTSKFILREVISQGYIIAFAAFIYKVYGKRLEVDKGL